MADNPPRWMSLNDVAKYIGVSRTTINNYRSTGVFPAPVEIGERRVAFKREEVDSWMEDRERTRPPLDRLAGRKSA